MLRLKAYYFFIFAALGALLPYLPLVFRDAGLSPGQIGLLYALTPIAQLLAPPFWGMAADRFGAALGLMRGAALGAAVCVGLFLFAQQPFAFAVLLVGFGLLRAPLAPLADAVASASIAAARRGAYARVRVWGSMGFASAAFALSQTGAAAGTWGLMVATAAYVLAATVLPASAGRRNRTRIGGELLGHILQPSFVLFFIGSVAYYAAHANVDAFLALHIPDQGFGVSWVGIAWGSGVLAEIVLMFTLIPWAVRRLRTTWLLIGCGLANALRLAWVADAHTTASLLGSQLLHGVSFGLWYVASVHWVQSRAPDHLRASVQTVASVAIGAGAIVAFSIGGQLYEHFGGPALFRAASMVALGSVLLYGLLNLREAVKPVGTVCSKSV